MCRPRAHEVIAARSRARAAGTRRATLARDSDSLGGCGGKGHRAAWSRGNLPHARALMSAATQPVATFVRRHARSKGALAAPLPLQAAALQTTSARCARAAGAAAPPPLSPCNCRRRFIRTSHWIPPVSGAGFRTREAQPRAAQPRAKLLRPQRECPHGGVLREHLSAPAIVRVQLYSAHWSWLLVRQRFAARAAHGGLRGRPAGFSRGAASLRGAGRAAAAPRTARPPPLREPASTLLLPLSRFLDAGRRATRRRHDA